MSNESRELAVRSNQRQVHFAEAIARFQAREPTVDFHIVDRFLASYEGGKYHRSVVHLMPVGADGRQAGTSVELMRQALGGRVDRSEVTRLAARYWGWVLPKLTQAQYDELLAQFKATQLSEN